MLDLKFSFSRFSLISTIAVVLITLPISAYSAKPDKNPSDSKGKGNRNGNSLHKKNTAAVITGIDSGSITEDVDPDSDNLLEFSATLNISDIDAGEAAFNQATIYGNYGSLTINSAGDWNYASNNSQSVIQSLGTGSNLTDSITVSSIDGTTHNIVINITGSNDMAIINGVSNGSVTEDVDPDTDNKLEVSGKLDVNDNDAGEAAFVSASHSGKYGNLTIDQNGNWNYSADNDQKAIQDLTDTASLNESLTVSSIDGTHHNILVTIVGADEPLDVNTPAVIGGVDSGVVTEDSDPNANSLLETSGTLTIVDPDPDEANFIAELKSGTYGSFSIDTQGNWSYAVDNRLSAIQDLANGQSIADNTAIRSIDGTSHNITVNIVGVDDTASSLSLSWVAPVEREDNTPISLTEISGYRIYYGISKGQYSSSVDINDGSATSYTFMNLTGGSYYFVVTTYDTEGRESLYSAEIEASL